MHRIYLLLLSCLGFFPCSCQVENTQHMTQTSCALPLKGQSNTRDLGGLPTQFGQIKKGLLFRSGDLSQLIPTDIEHLNKLQITEIIDFRSQQEIDLAPNLLPESVQKVHHLPIYNAQMSGKGLMELIRNKDTKALDTALEVINQLLVTNFQPEFTAFFKQIEKANAPVLFHCTAGKDRTGLAAALLLAALGASKEIILHDYLNSKHYLRSLQQNHATKLVAQGINAALLKPLLEVRENYLLAALQMIEQNYGGMQSFLTDCLQVDTKALQAKYLE